MSVRAVRVAVLAAIAAVAVGGLALAARPGQAGAAPGDVSVSVVNGLYGSNLSSVPVDVCLDGVEVATDLSSGGVVEVLSPPGPVQVVVAAHQAATACDAKATVYLDRSEAVSEGSIVFAYNGANGVGGAQPELIVPSFPCGPTDDATIAFINGANTGAVDVQVDGTLAIGSVNNGSGALAYRGAGAAALDVVPAGGGAALASDPAVAFAIGVVQFEFLVGGVGPTPADRDLGLLAFSRPARACGPPQTATAIATSVPPPTSTPFVPPVVTPAFTA
jgi:hypothetical protein